MADEQAPPAAADDECCNCCKGCWNCCKGCCTGCWNYCKGGCKGFWNGFARILDGHSKITEVFSSLLGCAVEIAAMLNEWHEVKFLSRVNFSAVSIGFAFIGLGFACLNFWALSKAQGAVWKRKCGFPWPYTKKRAENSETDGSNGHPWGSTMGIIAILFWATHFGLTIADTVGKQKHKHKAEDNGFAVSSVYPFIFSACEVTHAFLSCFGCERRYYVFCNQQAHVPRAPHFTHGVLLIDCPSCEHGWCAQAGHQVPPAARVRLPLTTQQMAQLNPELVPAANPPPAHHNPELVPPNPQPAHLNPELVHPNPQPDEES